MAANGQQWIDTVVLKGSTHYHSHRTMVVTSLPSGHQAAKLYWTVPFCMLFRPFACSLWLVLLFSLMFSVQPVHTLWALVVEFAQLLLLLKTVSNCFAESIFLFAMPFYRYG